MLVASVARIAFGQGGPPMITDDPGTPGNGKWENNFAIILNIGLTRPSIRCRQQIDLNYGVGEHIQLTLQNAPVLLKRSGHGLIGGLGGTEAAVKWRFLDEEKSGFDVSMFPRVIFNVAQSSVRRGLAEDGTRFQIPFQACEDVWPIACRCRIRSASEHCWSKRMVVWNCLRVRSCQTNNADGRTA